jgi:AraC-like DNA-binding protein
MQASEPPPPVIELTFEGEPNSKSFQAWHEECARGFFAMDFEPLDTDLFRMAVRFDCMPSLVIANGTGTPQRSSSPRSALAKTSGEFALLVPRCTQLHYAEGRRATDAGSGGVLLSDTSRPWQLELRPLQRLTAVRIPRQTLLALVPKAEDLSARPISAEPSLISLLAHTLDLAAAFNAQVDPLAREALSRHIFDLIALVLGVGGDTGQQAKERGLAVAKLAAMKTDVLARLADPKLSVNEAAARHKVSVRYVQKLFEQSGTTFTQFVLEQRLLMVRRQLINALNRARSVSEIAYACGFGDLSHFNHAFRRRFGASPSEVRAEGKDCLAEIAGSGAEALITSLE